MLTLKQNLILLTLVLAANIASVFADTCTITSFEDVGNIPSCSDVILKNLEVPAGKTLEINLQDGASLTFDGVTTFGNSSWHGPLISLKGNGVLVQSASDDAILDGQGYLYWDGKGEHSTTKPYFFHIEATNSVFKNINLYNCPLHCTDIGNTNDTVFYNWNINNTAGQPGIAPRGHEGHNTDGFFIYTSHNLLIKDSVIDNQDDCAVVRSGSNITISNLHCNGSHGLSLSAGDSKTSVIENTILNITFENSLVQNAENGIHVKTHTDGGAGEITAVTYKNITLSGISKYGIDVQQDYANGESTGTATGNIPITDLRIIDVRGTMSAKHGMPVYVFCAAGACVDWQWSGVEITGGKKADECINYKPTGYKC